MLIRRPVAQVFEAFVDPGITSKFWFTKGSGRLDAGKEVRWDWEMYGVSILVVVKSIEENKRILVEWPGYGTPTTVEWTFTPRADDTTFVTITNTGFSGDEKTIIKQALDSTEGFAMVLCGLKAYLEHNIQLNLVADRFPDANKKK
ncbi:polyketide cyclase [bacterium]|nr:MAG: polyketide cyclase [bacterium]